MKGMRKSNATTSNQQLQPTQSNGNSRRGPKEGSGVWIVRTLAGSPADSAALGLGNIKMTQVDNETINNLDDLKRAHEKAVKDKRTVVRCMLRDQDDRQKKVAVRPDTLYWPVVEYSTLANQRMVHRGGNGFSAFAGGAEKRALTQIHGGVHHHVNQMVQTPWM